MFLLLYLGVFNNVKSVNLLFFIIKSKGKKLSVCKITLIILTIGKNVALWKSTDQSTTYSANGISFTSDKAVDGNGDGNFNSHTCTHTLPDSYNPTWNVYLGNANYIIAIEIKNRNDNREYLF